MVHPFLPGDRAGCRGRAVRLQDALRVLHDLLAVGQQRARRRQLVDLLLLVLGPLLAEEHRAHVELRLAELAELLRDLLEREVIQLVATALDLQLLERDPQAFEKYGQQARRDIAGVFVQA